MQITVGQYQLDDDRSRVDRDVLWAFLSQEAYWGRWRTRSVVEQQLDTAWRVVGVYQASAGAMVGFARAVSDGPASPTWPTSSSTRSTAATASASNWSPR